MNQCCWFFSNINLQCGIISLYFFNKKKIQYQFWWQIIVYIPLKNLDGKQFDMEMSNVYP